MIYPLKPGTRISYIRARDTTPTIGIVVDNNMFDALWIHWDVSSNPQTLREEAREDTYIPKSDFYDVQVLGTLQEYDLEDI